MFPKSKKKLKPNVWNLDLGQKMKKTFFFQKVRVYETGKKSDYKQNMQKKLFFKLVGIKTEKQVSGIREIRKNKLLKSRIGSKNYNFF